MESFLTCCQLSELVEMEARQQQEHESRPPVAAKELMEAVLAKALVELSTDWFDSYEPQQRLRCQQWSLNWLLQVAPSSSV